MLPPPPRRRSASPATGQIVYEFLTQQGFPLDDGIRELLKGYGITDLVMLLLPLGFTLMLLQGLSEIIKRIGWLSGQYEGDFHYERPLQ